MSLLTADNYRKGLLVDDELIGGVTDQKDKPGTFAAYVLCHTTGEYLGFEVYENLDAALGAINAVQRSWAFATVTGGNCGNGECGGPGQKCGGSCSLISKPTVCAEPSAQHS